MKIQEKKDTYTYKPSVNINGFFIDRNPFISDNNDRQFHIVCPCSTRREKTYENLIQFRRHAKTKCHQQWLETMNLHKKIQQLETELFAVGSNHERVHQKEELWYGEIFPDHKDLIPNEDLWCEEQPGKLLEDLQYSTIFPQNEEFIHV